jgi:exopolysaccharide biosynthesis polyprenyl glycosylphosphotransferase
MNSTTPVTDLSTLAGKPRTRRWVSLPSLRLTVAERRVVLAVVDAVVLSSALLATLVLRDSTRFSWDLVVLQPHYYLLLIAVWIVSALFFDCYDLPRTADASQSAWAAARAALVTALVYLIIPFFTPHLPASRLSSILFVGLVTVSVPIWRVIYAVVFTQPAFQKRILIVGASQSGRKIAGILADTPKHGNPYSGSGFQLVGFVDDRADRVGTQIAGVPVMGTRHDLIRLVQQYDIDLLVIAIRHAPQIQPELFQALLDCRELGIDVELMIGLYERLTGRVPVEHAGQDLDLVVPVSDSAMQHFFSAGKRVVDLAAGVCGLTALAVLAPFIAFANAVWSPGPLFYRQLRVGKGGQPFYLYKLRSMIPAAEENCGATWACEDDDRVTPVGRFLRRTRLDEFPQFLNVLKGDMSLVGPRPERPEFVAGLVDEVPFYQARHAVRPGVSGWAQVRYRYGSSVEDALVKLEYDLYYIRHQSIYLELSVLVKTVAVMLGLKGR